MIVPVLASHKERYGKQQVFGQSYWFVLRLLQFFGNGQSAESDIDGKGVEGEDVGVVAFTRFVDGVVEVDGEEEA